MSDPVRRIADAVLYEGYLLWPYRRSALKNQQRWNFGCVMPPAWSAEHSDEVSEVGTQVLVEGEEPRVDVTLRFLHVVRRQLFDEDGGAIDRFEGDDGLQLTWDEATEREIVVERVGSSTVESFMVVAGSRAEEVGRRRIEHSWYGLTGSVAVPVVKVERGLHRVSVTVANTTAGARWRDHDAPTETVGTLRAVALDHAFCSAHVVLRVTGGAFVSPLDPLASAQCAQQRMWPVLVGEPPDRSTILATEIMLEEYPRIAPESPGDLFDGGEVDQLLTLNILGMTDAERAEMRASDPRARAILERTEAMTANDMMRLHGTIRDRPVVDQP